MSHNPYNPYAPNSEKYSERNVTKKYRPQFTIIELYIVEYALAISAGVEPMIPPEYTPTKEEVYKLLEKVATYRVKAELGANSPAYVMEHAKPGRKSAADIIREDMKTSPDVSLSNSLTQEEPNYVRNAQDAAQTASQKKLKPSPKEHNLFMYNRYTSSYGASITSAMNGDSPMGEEDIYAALTHKLEAGETLEEEEKRLFNKVQMQQFMSPE